MVYDSSRRECEIEYQRRIYNYANEQPLFGSFGYYRRDVADIFRKLEPHLDRNGLRSFS